MKFAKAMNEQLTANAHKDEGGKEGWHEYPPLYLEKKLLEEVAELIWVTTGGTSSRTAHYWAEIFREQFHKAQTRLDSKSSAKDEAADVGNISLMLADNNGGL